ncbi:MAG TPA: hypothetical protein VJW73_09590 [Gemmatimonadaceae bacterium]|nr:hypothetical protein [Gemmatimonadaceae bacterium]
MKASRLAAITTVLVAVACQADRTTSVATISNGFPKGPNTAVVASDAPGTFTIFPSLVVTGSFSSTAAGYVSVPSVSDVDRTFQLTSSNPSVLPNLPATVTMPAGADRANVNIATAVVSTQTTVTLSLSGGGVTESADLTLYPPGSTLPPPILDTIFATPLTVTGGQASTATIRLTSPAPTGGLVVSLFTRLPLSATMPPTVTFPAGATTATVPITTYPGFPNSTTSVLIEAAALNTLVSNGVNVVTGDVTQPLGIGTTTFNAPLVNGVATVVGGTVVGATISLTGAAPSGGALVQLVSTDTTVATVPTSVTIPAGATSASFTVTTKPVIATTSSNIGGSFAGGVVVSTLQVTPATTAPPPSASPLPAPALLSPASDARFARGQTVTFDWSDVSGAASYTIQISDNDKFSSPLVSQSVSPSQFSLSTLPATRLWWRVRAVSASGTAGTFSSARRFEVK